MRNITHITIEHIVVASNRSFEQVIQALEAQLGRKVSRNAPRSGSTGMGGLCVEANAAKNT